MQCKCVTYAKVHFIYFQEIINCIATNNLKFQNILFLQYNFDELLTRILKILYSLYEINFKKLLFIYFGFGK